MGWARRLRTGCILADTGKFPALRMESSMCICRRVYQRQCVARPVNKALPPLRRRVNWSLREILRGSDGVFTLYYNTPDGATELRARSVALTAPAYVVADLVRAAVPNASDALKSFDYPPVGAVTLAYPLSAIRDDRKAADGSVPGAHAGVAAAGLQLHGAAC